MYNNFTLIILNVYSKHTFLDCNQNSSIKKLPLCYCTICIVKGYYKKKTCAQPNILLFIDIEQEIHHFHTGCSCKGSLSFTWRLTKISRVLSVWVKAESSL